MMPRRTAIILAAILALVPVGCATAGRDSDPFVPGGANGQVKVFVTNLAFTHATLWGVTTGTRHKLGIVAGKREAAFTMLLPFPTEMHIEIDILAGPKCFTERLTVDPGDELELIIQNDGANLNCIRR